MTGAMSTKLIKYCASNYEVYDNTDLKAKGVTWMREFQKEPDDLMETAVRSCVGFCKKFPTVADIKEAIRDLQYEEEVKPKQLPWGGKWEEPQAKKVFEMANGNQDTKAYLASVDVTELTQYARLFFKDISEQLVIQNYPELVDGKKGADMCWNCRIDKNACLTQGWIIKHNLDKKTGRIKNEMARCQKNIR